MNALAKLYGQLTGRKDLNPLTEILVTCGAFEALYVSIAGLVEEGDEVIIIEPFFDCYEPMVRAARGIPKFVPLRPKGEVSDAGCWQFDDTELTGAFNERTKLIIVNTPHNPLGKVFTKTELERIAELCKQWNVVCISDEVYEWLTYEPNKHIRMCTLPGMWERTITIGSAGKTFSVTGWKLGWAYGPSELLHNLHVVHQNCVYTNCTPVQEAVARAFEHEMSVMGTKDCYFTQLPKELRPKRDFVAKFLTNAGFKTVMPQGGYFFMADWTGLANKCDLSAETDQYRDYKFTKWLSKNVGVQFIPPSAFFSKENKYLGEDYIRLCFIKVRNIKFLDG